MDPIISIVIVTYNPTPVTHLCFWALEQCQLKNSEIIVIDNSTDFQFTQELEVLYPFIRLFKNPKNKGFGNACNKGFEFARGEIILFLNPDTIVPSDLEKKILTFFEEHPSAGAMGVKMIDAFGNFLPESKRNFPTPTASFLKFSGLNRFFNKNKKQWHYYADHLNPETMGKVQILSGAFMAVRRTAMEQTGGFDPRFFLYAEDIDLSFSITEKGFFNWYNPDITIVHLKGESSYRNKNYIRYFFESMIGFYKKHYLPKHSYLKRFFIISLIKIIQAKQALKHKKKQVEPSSQLTNGIDIHKDSSTETMEELRKKFKDISFRTSYQSLSNTNYLISTKNIAPSRLIELIKKSHEKNITFLIHHPESGWLLQLKGKDQICLPILNTAIN